ncbi:unnamed protein product [Spirodela intermedia]|uniref:Uncharacterized protein n=1 Tax=Spirodela intermedia TaxID=51605 RepID=A0A7I8JEW2_SPIIN|nr:unnamed protein product [Spirodela intermedia]CAA6668690.1 unnamed protein product [Spirodela intermedia]
MASPWICHWKTTMVVLKTCSWNES